MNTDIIIMNADVAITDENGNKIEICSYNPEVLKIWV